MRTRSHLGGIVSWLRARSRGGATLALFAMALQLVATFGHVHHFADISKSPAFKAGTISKPPMSKPSISKPSIAAELANAVAPPDAGTLPPGGDGDALCAICLVGHLVATAVFTPPPVPALPIAYLLLGPPPSVAVHHPADIAASFWSRGPPLS